MQTTYRRKELFGFTTSRRFRPSCLAPFYLGGTPWLLGLVVEDSCLLQAWKGRGRQELGTGCHLPAPRDPLTSSRPYLPKFPEPLKVIPPARNQTLNTSLGGTLKAQTVTAVSGTGWQWCCVSDPRLFASFLGIPRKSGMSRFLTSAQPQG